MVLSLAIPNNLVLTMSSLIGTTLATRRMQNLETLHYYVFNTLFPLLGYLDDQCSEFLESWMAYLEFKNIIEYYTTTVTSTQLKEEYNTMENCTLLKDIDNFMYLTQLYFLEDTPNQIQYILRTLLLWLKTFYTTISQYPTLYNFLAITPEEICHAQYYLTYPKK